jgi:hypothetical protein
MSELQFDEMERGRFLETAKLMKFVGIFWVVIAALMLFVMGIMALLVSVVAVTFAAKGTAGGYLQFLLAFLDEGALAAAGVYTVLTAGSLVKLAEGPVDAREGMMTVLGNLRTTFVLYAATVGVDVVTDVIELLAK